MSSLLYRGKFPYLDLISCLKVQLSFPTFRFDLWLMIFSKKSESCWILPWKCTCTIEYIWNKRQLKIDLCQSVLTFQLEIQFHFCTEVWWIWLVLIWIGSPPGDLPVSNYCNLTKINHDAYNEVKIITDHSSFFHQIVLKIFLNIYL